MNTKIFYWIHRTTLIALGVFFIIFGGYDDSPGLQGIGLILIVITITKIIKDRNKK